MSILGSSWLEEGYYEQDSYGDKTRLTTKEEIKNAFMEGKLYHHDGYGLTKIEDIDQLNK